MTARVGRQQHAADLFAAPTLLEVDSPMSHRVLAAFAKRGFRNGRCEAVCGGGATDLGDTICRSHGTNRTTGRGGRRAPPASSTATRSIFTTALRSAPKSDSVRRTEGVR
jgi:hypothetical protein